MVVASRCPDCGDGDVGFRIAGEFMFLLCGNCGLAWMHPARLEAKDAVDPLDPAFAKRYPGADLRRSRWATQEQVQDEGWSVYLLKPQELTADPPGEPTSGPPG